MTSRRLAGWAAAIVAIIAGLLMWINWPEDPAKRPPPTDFKTIMAGLAGQTKANLGDADDFSVLPTEIAMPIGTVMRVSTTVPIDDEACLAVPEPHKNAAPNFSPSIKMSRRLAGDFGLAKIVPVLGGTKLAAERNDELEVSFDDVGYRILSDSKLDGLLKQPACRAAFGGQPRWVVRGYVAGTRRLIIRNARDNSLAGDIEKVSDFQLSGSGKDELSFIDKTETPFLELVSVVTPPEPGKPAVQATPAAPVAAQTPGLLYVQRDRADRSGDPADAVEALKRTGVSVASAVEAIASDKMPSTTQVRYFNDGDRALAGQVAATLKADYPDVQIIRVGLPAPRGQLEAWLVKH
jgi:hypothetical protein